MDSMFTDKVKPEMQRQHQGQLDALPEADWTRYPDGVMPDTNIGIRVFSL